MGRVAGWKILVQCIVVVDQATEYRVVHQAVKISIFALLSVSGSYLKYGREYGTVVCILVRMKPFPRF